MYSNMAFGAAKSFIEVISGVSSQRGSTVSGYVPLGINYIAQFGGLL